MAITRNNAEAAEVFASEHNIVIGRGRVLWGPETTDANNRYHPAGWVLPGGKRTQSRDVAEAVAHRINQLSI